MKSGTAEGGKTMAIEEAEQRGGGRERKELLDSGAVQHSLVASSKWASSPGNSIRLFLRLSTFYLWDLMASPNDRSLLWVLIDRNLQHSGSQLAGSRFLHFFFLPFNEVISQIYSTKIKKKTHQNRAKQMNYYNF